MTSERIRVGLVNEYEMPVDEYIFNQMNNPLDIVAIRKVIAEFLAEEVGIEQYYGSGLNQCDYTDVQCFRGEKELMVYLPGKTAMTMAVAELISLCALNGIKLTLMHYQKDAGIYQPQKMF